jgi:hypothetical protein
LVIVGVVIKQAYSLIPSSVQTLDQQIAQRLGVRAEGRLGITAPDPLPLEYGEI